MSKSIEELKSLATQIRRDILRMVHAVNSGHPGGSLGCTEFFAALYDVSDKKWLVELLEKTGLTAHQSKLVKHLSGGLKRRLNFAIGLINRPKVIFLDEITVGIDPQSRQFILDSVADLTKQGVTVIYTSHYLQEIEQLCDKLVLLNEGRLIYLGSVQGILSEGQSLERFYLDFLGRVC